MPNPNDIAQLQVPSRRPDVPGRAGKAVDGSARALPRADVAGAMKVTLSREIRFACHGAQEGHEYGGGLPLWTSFQAVFAATDAALAAQIWDVVAVEAALAAATAAPS